MRKPSERNEFSQILSIFCKSIGKHGRCHAQLSKTHRMVAGERG